MSDLVRLIQELKLHDAEQKRLVEIIKTEARKNDIPLTSNLTSCNQPNCKTCQLGFYHGPYLITQRQGRRVRVKKQELIGFLSKFLRQELVAEFVKLQNKRHKLLLQINNLVRWHECERQNVRAILRYCTKPDEFASMLGVRSENYLEKLAEQGSKVLLRLMDTGISRLENWLNRQSIHES